VNFHENNDKSSGSVTRNFCTSRITYYKLPMLRSCMVHFPSEFLPWVSLRDMEFVTALREREFRYIAAPLSLHQCHGLIVNHDLHFDGYRIQCVLT
jgi:hypothetical protein